jgi:hypothetical protein
MELDCGDNSCLFATNKGGMRTNGGCRCIPPGNAKLSIKVQEILNASSAKDAEIALLKAEVEKWKKEADTTWKLLHKKAEEVELLREDYNREFEHAKNHFATANALRTENAALREKVKKAIAIGHNDDCMFCGFKDKILGGTE